MDSLLAERNYLIHMLASLVNAAPPANPPENLNWARLYEIAAYHHLSNMLCYGIEKLEPQWRPEQATMEKFQRDRKFALAKEAAQHFTLEQVLRTLEKHRIFCLPLKGYLIKYLYPRPDMRLMADLDILFKDEQTEEVKELMLGMGFTLKHFGANHDVYVKEPFINIEMHRRLVAQDSPYSGYLKKTWARARLEEGSQYIHRLSWEDFYIYLLIHLAKHFSKGGTGIRSILDIWLYEKHYGPLMDRNYIQRELEEIKLQEFARHMVELGQVWFGQAESNELYDEIADYILASGMYGTGKHGIITAINKNQGHGPRSTGLMKLRYRLKIFFPGLKHMSILYPFLHRLPFLLPVSWVLRGLKCLVGKRQRTFIIIRNIQSVSMKDLKRIQALHEKTGL